MVGLVLITTQADPVWSPGDRTVGKCGSEPFRRFGFTVSSDNLDCCSFKCLNCHEIVRKMILKGTLGANGIRII